MELKNSIDKNLTMYLSDGFPSVSSAFMFIYGKSSSYNFLPSGWVVSSLSSSWALLFLDLGSLGLESLSPSADEKSGKEIV